MTPPNPAAQALEPLSCPFCGGPPTVQFAHEWGRWDVYEVECEACIYSRLGPTGHEGDKARAAAIAAWNRRTPPPAPSADWITVPRVPTEAMVEAGWKEADDYVDHSPGGVRNCGDRAAKWVWRAMLSAAPPPPAPDEAVVERLREALEPFARIGDLIDLETTGFDDEDELPLTSEDGFLMTRFSIGAFRRAARALAALPHPIAGEKGE